ncbi:hypothetical protein D3C84_653170 [compost metagenome]
MAGEELAEHPGQQRRGQLLAFQRGQRQVQARHVDAARRRVVEADSGCDPGGEALAEEDDRLGDAGHADPLQWQAGGGGLRGDIGQGQAVHRQSLDGQAGENVML